MAKYPSQMNPGRSIVCCWDTCTNDGDTRYAVNERASNGGNLILLFCCEIHRKLFQNSHRDMGNAPAGWRRPRLSPGGISVRTN